MSTFANSEDPDEMGYLPSLLYQNRRNNQSISIQRVKI